MNKTEFVAALAQHGAMSKVGIKCKAGKEFTDKVNG